MSSKVTAVSATLPARRRRESSDDFGTGSLGSIAGSAFGGNSTDKAAPAPDNNKTPIDTLEIASTASTKGSGSALSPSSGRRPFRKRTGIVDLSLNFDDDTTFNSNKNDDCSKIIPAVDALPPIDALPIDSISESDNKIIRGSRSQSITLDHLDALGNEAGEVAARIKDKNVKPRANSFSIRSRDSDNSSSHGTMTSQSHRFLLDAFMGDAEESLMLDQKRDRLGSFDTRDRSGSFESRDKLGSFDIRDRLDSFDVRADRAPSFDVRELAGSLERGRSGGAHFRRERLESWGGMSDISAPLHGESANDPNSSSAAAIAAKLYTSLANDITAAANLDGNGSVSSFLVSDEVIPTKISVTRERLNSIASESSALDIPLPAENELGSELQKFVKAAMASVGDQIAELATTSDVGADNVQIDHESLASSTISPMIGAASDTASKATSLSGRPRSNSTSSALNIAVDYDAVVAAVNAAQAAAGAIDLETFASMGPPPKNPIPSTIASSSVNKKRRAPKLPFRKENNIQSSCHKKPPPSLPLHMKLPPIPQSKMDDKDMEILRQRARAAAGYVPPSSLNGSPMPPKKKPKIDLSHPQTPGYRASDLHQTPRTSNTTYKSLTPGTPYTPAMSTPGSAKSALSKGQSSQKWDSMFDCLLEFIRGRKKDETKDMSEEEIKKWIWDGNVPTTFKTKDCKALGRWVNNQRSAKSKGVLKDDREKRLVDAGLKWSVLASNSWNEMLEELRIYVVDQTKAGRKWDGNVPTNYRIKTKINVGSKDDEDKNLGRWVNRQRSLYQAGKLRKDRQHALEKVGLKWSMLATTSWESMYDTLCDYVKAKTKDGADKAKTKDGAEWDGNVPANYRTEDNPPRALGRWINRQRSAYGKEKLKSEYVEKLNKIGLKWSVHERRPVATPESVKSASLIGARPAPSMATIKAVVKNAASAAIANGISTSKPGFPPKSPVIVRSQSIAAVKTGVKTTMSTGHTALTRPYVAVKTQPQSTGRPPVTAKVQPVARVSAVAVITQAKQAAIPPAMIKTRPEPSAKPTSVAVKKQPKPAVKPLVSLAQSTAKLPPAAAKTRPQPTTKPPVSQLHSAAKPSAVVVKTQLQSAAKPSRLASIQEPPQKTQNTIPSSATLPKAPMIIKKEEPSDKNSAVTAVTTNTPSKNGSIPDVVPSAGIARKKVNP